MSRPLLILAPMYHVTDTVFRQVVAGCAPPDVFVTEFANVDGLQSPGRPRVEPYLYLEETAVPVWAQIWGKDPENYRRTAVELAEAGFAGIDINMGCPDKTVLKNNACSALIKPENRQQAAEIIVATKAGAGGLPVSVKTRLGFAADDLSWHEFLLRQGIDCLSVHARTVTEMSRAPARWREVGRIKALAERLAPRTKIIGNGDIVSRSQALELCRTHGWDGAMIGRGIFEDPFLFAEKSPWAAMPPAAKAGLYRRHLELFLQTYKQGERKFDPLKKFMKVYLNGFEGAAGLRAQIAVCRRAEEAIRVLEGYLAGGGVALGEKK